MAKLKATYNHIDCRKTLVTIESIKEVKTRTGIEAYEITFTPQLISADKLWFKKDSLNFRCLGSCADSDYSDFLKINI